jgi:polar amino acid transport system substrate-binding protein
LEIIVGKCGVGNSDGAFSGRRRKLLAVMLPVLLAPVLGSGKALPAETALERIRRTGVVRIGYAPEPPFSFRLPDGRLTGSGPEVARRVFAAMGVSEIQGVESEFGTLIRDLKAGRFDVIAIGMFVLPDRCREVAFSEPFYKAGVGFAVRPGNPANLHGFDDVAASPSVRLGVVAGAVELNYARESGVDDRQLVLFPDAAAAAGGVRAGRVDAFAAMGVTVQDLVRRSPRQLERADPFRNPVIGGRSFLDHGGFGFRPGDGELREVFNRHLLDLLRSPGYLALIEPFGFTSADLPDRTTAELCAP